jgi:hypothetical protein
MKWNKIKQLHPDKFILIRIEKEEKISENEFRIISGDVIETSTDLKQIMKSYQEEKEKGKNVLYSLPSTPDDFIVENVPLMGIVR